MAQKADDLDRDIQQTRRKIEGTALAMTEKLETLERRLAAATQNLKCYFDLREQTRRRPWLMFGASILAGCLLGGRRRRALVRASSPGLRAQRESSTMKGELVAVKSLALGAVIRAAWELVRRARRAASRAERAAHAGRNGGPGEAQRL
jgi:hypothetical protein